MTDTLTALGILLICVGGYLNPPAGLVAVGCALIGASVVIARRKVARDVSG